MRVKRVKKRHLKAHVPVQAVGEVVYSASVSDDMHKTERTIKDCENTSRSRPQPHQRLLSCCKITSYAAMALRKPEHWAAVHVKLQSQDATACKTMILILYFLTRKALISPINVVKSAGMVGIACR